MYQTIHLNPITLTVMLQILPDESSATAHGGNPVSMKWTFMWSLWWEFIFREEKHNFFLTMEEKKISMSSTESSIQLSWEIKNALKLLSFRGTEEMFEWSDMFLQNSDCNSVALNFEA